MRTAAAVTLVLAGVGPATTPGGPGLAHADGCSLANGAIRRVIWIHLDNVHFTRDDPNVPSDLEQMPNLLDFMRSNGALLPNHQTALVAHTANNFVTTLTGVYGDRHGLPVSNTFRYFNPDGTTASAVGFAYWTARVSDGRTLSPTNSTYTMVTAEGKNAPAPWVPFTRAGCNFGAAGVANIVLENSGVDLADVFGADSPEARQAADDPNQARADHVGVVVHCARGAALCSAANRGVPDRLPDEPSGYEGFSALFGHKYVEPHISRQGPLLDLEGRVIADASGRNGFPGFDGMPAWVSLAYAAAMQENGIPITAAYISDAHSDRAARTPYGPGEAGYVANLRRYDAAFGTFFARLAARGINTSNTLFIFGADEGDHFVGSAPSPVGCDGVTTPCSYTTKGEVGVNVRGLLATEFGVTTPFDFKSAASPTFYVIGRPGRTVPAVRTLERAAGQLEVTNPYTGRVERLANTLADPIGMNLLHMQTGDPTRTATLALFAKPDYFVFASRPDCIMPCVAIDPGFAWIHGTIAPDINTTWVGLVGPGVRQQGVRNDIWSDLADVRPTLLALTGLNDRSGHQGRVIFETFTPNAVPRPLRANGKVALRLGQAYKQINAQVGQLALDALTVSTRALTGDDARYDELTEQLVAITAQRHALASQMESLLAGASFFDQPIDPAHAEDLIAQAESLLRRVRALAE
jgi:hypothetical protein